MESLGLIVLIVVMSLFRIAVLRGNKEEGGRTRETPAAEKPAAPAPSVKTREKPKSRTSVPIPRVREQKHVQMARAAQWRAAKAQQDDAEQVHSIKMDSCESRLESLRVLYEAGILDRQEYAERVARVRANHAHAAREE